MLIKAIGFSRVLLLVVLALFVGGLLFYNQVVLKQEAKEIELAASRASSGLRNMQDKTVQLEEGFKFFTKEKDKYFKINRIGFFNVQGRFEAGQRLKLILDSSDLLSSSKYSLSPAKPETYDKLFAAGYQILSSDMTFELDAVKDSDVYDYIFTIVNGFPGVVTINSIEMNRTLELTQPVLRQLGNNIEQVPIVKAKIQATWRSATQVINGEGSSSAYEGGL